MQSDNSGTVHTAQPRPHSAFEDKIIGFGGEIVSGNADNYFIRFPRHTNAEVYEISQKLQEAGGEFRGCENPSRKSLQEHLRRWIEDHHNTRDRTWSRLTIHAYEGTLQVEWDIDSRTMLVTDVQLGAFFCDQRIFTNACKLMLAGPHVRVVRLSPVEDDDMRVKLEAIGWTTEDGNNTSLYLRSTSA